MTAIARLPHAPPATAALQRVSGEGYDGASYDTVLWSGGAHDGLFLPQPAGESVSMRTSRTRATAVAVVAVWLMGFGAAQAQMQPQPMATPPGWMDATLRAEALMKRGAHMDAASIYEQYSATVPWFPASHYLRVQALLKAKRTDLVAAALAAARTGIPRTAPMRSEAAMFALSVVADVPGLPRADVSRLITEAHALADEAMAADPRSGEAMRMKARVLMDQAEKLETDAARKAALEKQADALMEKSFRGR